MTEPTVVAETIAIPIFSLMGIWLFAVILAALSLLAGILFLFAKKEKRDFALSLLDFCTKFCLLSTGCIYLIFWIRHGMVLGFYRNQLPWNIYEVTIVNLWEASYAPANLFVIAWFAFIIKSAVTLKQKFANQNLDPIVTTPVDKVEAQSTQGHV